MAVIPKRTKHRLNHRVRYDGMSKGNTELHFGDYGLMATEGNWITQQQIEAARVAMTRYMNRGGKVFTNIFPHFQNFPIFPQCSFRIYKYYSHFCFFFLIWPQFLLFFSDLPHCPHSPTFARFHTISPFLTFFHI